MDNAHYKSECDRILRLNLSELLTEKEYLERSENDSFNDGDDLSGDIATTLLLNLVNKQIAIKKQG